MTRFRMRPLRLRKKAGTFLAVAATLMAAAGAAAWTTSAATIVHETITQAISESGLSDDCRHGITGDLDTARVFEYQSIETANGYHVQGTDSDAGRIDWSEGSYTLIESVDRFALSLVGIGRTEVFTPSRTWTRERLTRRTARSSSAPHSTRSSTSRSSTACRGSRSSEGTSIAQAPVEQSARPLSASH